ncbi:MAG: TPM domain-containing protein, partial [Chitinophagales bacterium]|nr:TPM domain-containing protein [Chitinophagales bacterium]
MIRSTLCLFLIFFTVNLFAQTVHTVESIPNPKTSYGGLVSNPDNVLSASAVSTINQLLLALEDSTTAQVAVAVVNSIG